MVDSHASRSQIIIPREQVVHFSDTDPHSMYLTIQVVNLVQLLPEDSSRHPLKPPEHLPDNIQTRSVTDQALSLLWCRLLYEVVIS